MKHVIGIFLTAFLLMAGFCQISLAADCRAAAQRVLSTTGGDLLSALPAGNGDQCTVTVIIPAKNGNPPRKVTKQVPAS